MSLFQNFAVVAGSGSGAQELKTSAEQAPGQPDENLFAITGNNASTLLRAAFSGQHDGISFGISGEFSGVAKDRREREKDASTREVLARMAAQQIQDKIQKSLDSMRKELGEKIDLRLAELRKQLQQMREDAERFALIQDKIINQGLWSLDKDEARIFKDSVGEETYNNVVILDKRREAAAEAVRQNPTAENQVALEKAKGAIVQEIKPHVEDQQRKIDEANLRIKKLEELRDGLEEGLGYEVVNGKFSNRLLQEAAEKAGLNPADYKKDDIEYLKKMDKALGALHSSENNILDKFLGQGQQNPQGFTPVLNGPQQQL